MTSQSSFPYKHVDPSLKNCDFDTICRELISTRIKDPDILSRIYDNCQFCMFNKIGQPFQLSTTTVLRQYLDKIEKRLLFIFVLSKQKQDYYVTIQALGMILSTSDKWMRDSKGNGTFRLGDLTWDCSKLPGLWDEEGDDDEPPDVQHDEEQEEDERETSVSNEELELSHGVYLMKRLDIPDNRYVQSNVLFDMCLKRLVFMRDVLSGDPMDKDFFLSSFQPGERRIMTKESLMLCLLIVRRASPETLSKFIWMELKVLLIFLRTKGLYPGVVNDQRLVDHKRNMELLANNIEVKKDSEQDDSWMVKANRVWVTLQTEINIGNNEMS